MRIAFDGTTLQPRRTGVGYYTEHLLHHLSKERGADDVVVVSNGPVETARPLPPEVTTHVSGRHLPRLAWLQFEAPRALRRLGADVAHFTNGMVPVVSSVPTVVTVHDMSLTLYPQLHPRRRVWLNRPLVDLAVRRADAIITVSQSARADIVRHYELPPGRVHVVHEAPAPAFKPVRDAGEVARVRARYRLADRVVLYVGTIEPRKNLPALLEAFAAGRRRGTLAGHQLVCVGPYGWLSRDIDARVDALGLRDVVRFTGYVPFGDLPALYSAAEMFVFPSVYEGFGLPVVEAMACGTPVVTGRSAALSELSAGAIEHAEGLDAASIGDAMARLASSRERREHRSLRGLQRAQMFSWTRAARETLAIYRRVASRRAEQTGLETLPFGEDAMPSREGSGS